MDVGEQVNLLYSKEHNLAYQALKELQNESEKSNLVYGYMDQFIEMMGNDNSYLRTRGIVLIACNAKWDTTRQIEKIIDRYMEHITDSKPITARQCIKMIPIIAKYKENLRQQMITCLQNADVSIYSEGMQRLVCSDMKEALQLLGL